MDEEEARIDIELYQVLKDQAIEEFIKVKDNKDLSLTDIENIQNKYDIDPNINFFYLNKCLDIYKSQIDDSEESMDLEREKKEEDLVYEFSEKYYNYIDSLLLWQKKDIINKIQKTKRLKTYLKNYMNVNSNIKQYFEIINKIKNVGFEDLDSEEFKNKFYTKYYKNLLNYHIPLIYGTTELRYAYLINDIRVFLFEKEMQTEKSVIENNYARINALVPDIILKKKSNPLDVINKEDKNKTNEEEEIQSNITFHNKYNFLSEFLSSYKMDLSKIFNIKKYNDNDKYEENFFTGAYKLNDKIDEIYFHLLYLALIMFCYLYYPDKIDETINKIRYFFFENKNAIIKALLKAKNIYKCEIKKIDSEIEFEKEELTFFNLKKENEYYTINPYDFILKNIRIKSTYEKFIEQFKDESNYSLYKVYKDNHLFQDEDIYISYKDNINKMLKSDIIDQAFNQFSNYEKFINPFKGKNADQIINQINSIKYYINFPILKIDGLTFKKLGIIFINKLLKNVSDTSTEKKLIKFTINLSYKKITESHEIIGHYMNTLCKANLNTINLLTPDNTFIDYTSNDSGYKRYQDGGDSLELLLFGNKILYITIQSSLFIIDENNWNNINIEDFKEKFILKNKLEANYELNILSQCNNQLIKNILQNIKCDNSESIIVSKRDSFIAFRKGYIHIDDEDLFYDDDSESE